MRLVVCLKQVPDTSAQLRVAPGGLAPLAAASLPVPNPYDEFALEAALRLRESGGAAAKAEIVLLTAAAEPVDETVFHGLAMGADRAVVLELPPGSRPDPLAAARLLAREAEGLAPALVLCGERAADDDAAQVGPALAEALGLPQVCGVESFELDAKGRTLRARCRRGTRTESRACTLPCMLTFVRGPALPRYPALDAILSAGEKPVLRKPAKPGKNRVERVALDPVPDERSGEVLRVARGRMTPEEAARSLLDRIDARVSLLA